MFYIILKIVRFLRRTEDRGIIRGDKNDEEFHNLNMLHLLLRSMRYDCIYTTLFGYEKCIYFET
jgi:hypothetical protein